MCYPSSLSSCGHKPVTMQQNRNFHLRTYLSPCSKGKQEARKQDTLPSADRILTFHLLQGENIKLTSRKPKTTKCYKNHVHNPQRAAVFPPVLAAASGCPRARQDSHFVFSASYWSGKQEPTEVHLGSPVATNRIWSLKLLTVTCVHSCSEHARPPRITQTLLRHS